jgi:cation diffusion facilitator CzcD-associated flavoprotein CzcO
MLGTYEFSDFPMDPEIYDLKPGQHIPGPTMHKYLTNYAERFDLVKRIRFETKVESAEHKEGGGWLLRLTAGFKDENALGGDEIYTKKLVLATGLTSDPFLPKIAGSEIFDAPLFHSKEFLDYEDTLQTAKTVTVFGGTKSAWDAVYAYASKGVKVDWVIRGAI